MIRQLALDIPINEQKTLDNFIWLTNPLLQKTIETLSVNEEHYIFLFGQSGSGKSHLLQGLCQAQSRESLGVYLPLRLLKDWGSESILGMSEKDLVLIDDIEAIAGDKRWEEALFYLFNQCRDKDKGLLVITGNSAPASLGIQLADLSSRLCSGLVMPLLPLADEEKIQVLQTQAKTRGIELTQGVSQYILNHCGRNLTHLSDLLEKLDKASLAAQRKITVPFAKAILGI